MKIEIEQLSRKEKAVYEVAQATIEKGAGAIEFSELFFGTSGRLRELWSTDAERKAVVKSALFKWLQERLTELRRREGEAFTQEVEALSGSGRLTVVVPKSLHGALKNEAALEGISLSELIRLKLGVSYRSMVRLLDRGGRTPAASA